MSRAADLRPLLRVAAATLLAAGTGAWWPAPAQAAECSGPEGVTVVVDYSGAGGSGIDTSCVPGGGGDSAGQLFASAGHTLTRVQRQPGAVCKVDGLRKQDACVNMPPGNAFWGLFWSDGEGGWVFSQEGVDNLSVPDGGSVAWAWQNGGGYDYPGTPPASHSDPAEGGSGSGSGGGRSSGGGSGGAESAPGSPTAAASPQPDAASQPPARREARASAGGEDAERKAAREKAGGERDRRRDDGRARVRADRPGEETSPAAEAPEGSAVTSEPAASPEEGLPAWVAPAAIAALFAFAGIAAYLRRRAA